MKIVKPQNLNIGKLTKNLLKNLNSETDINYSIFENEEYNNINLYQIEFKNCKFNNIRI